MLETQFSLSWEQHMYNISYGLSKFQQNGEFVDMTLAADGSFVKAHQMILSLVSPYIKAIIDSLKCTHPVIFLNNISYRTLCSILDYVYKGEVQVTNEQLKDLINAGKVLQIKGLQEMETSTNFSSNQAASTNIISSEEENKMSQIESEIVVESEDQIDTVDKDPATFDNDQDFVIEDDQNEVLEIKDDNVDLPNTTQNDSKDAHSSFIINQDIKEFPSPFFTTSNQGSLQLVFNRYLYFLKYKSMRASGHLQWKCVNYINIKCPAFIITKNDKVIQKYVRHTHSYHDVKIAKKVESGSLFSTMRSAEEFGMTRKFANYKHIRGKISYTSM